MILIISDLECEWSSGSTFSLRSRLWQLALMADLRTRSLLQGGAHTDEHSGNIQGLVIVATLLCSSMRGARLQERKVWFWVP